MNTGSDFYQLIKKVNASRKKSQIWKQPMVQRYVDNNFYAYSRGRYLVAVTNSGTQQRKVTYHPFNNGETVCNVFNGSDCQQVNNGVNVYLSNGESKIYVPKGDLPRFANENGDLEPEEEEYLNSLVQDYQPAEADEFDTDYVPEMFLQ